MTRRHPDHALDDVERDAEALAALRDLDSADAQRWLAALTTDFAAGAAELDAGPHFPHGNLARLRRAGLLSLTVPRALGGHEATLPQTLNVIRAVARGEPSTALILVMQCLYHLRLQANPNWPAHLKERLAKDAVERGALINSLRVEPELGSPSRGGLPATVGARDGGHWTLNGRKLYSTGSPGLTWFAVWGRTDEASPRVGTWLVHRDTPGIRFGAPWNHLGMRATGSHEVIFENVRVPFDQAVDLQPPGPNTGMDPVTSLWMNVLVPSIYDGVARAARDWFVQWAASRVPSGLNAPLSSLDGFQQTAGRIESLLLNNRVLLDAGAAGQLTAAEAPAIKYLVSRNAIEAVELALEASSNPGLSRDNPLERHYRDVLCARIHTPQNDTVLGNLGRAAYAAR
ncbi:acyl-CoA dehydrogenase family protein [Paraburkholderia caballeronis]|uniref:acyl-CoA dehydrogenase family protein n=1 Tax=Paraburkholderia caballeronis TaxID=416943 RepID=UPI0010661B23|nr:acyl-CoA dehydrogenase family protein [Paraburkholderia caballeronis]TDV19475.1 alkylation response protein AidB-like acyl-CoA dehydrogenase [Paraburkholderia caballeronis]TDV22075.1 alkylation response protein AidB-like acyl-CoA dehydrogenase [Paraburkholderia caballeronis]TDV28979.1 alkylation response protein AidB-like acyl-CoA dehydrogenase [Paraburkholderia caballeronis]